MVKEFSDKPENQESTEQPEPALVETPTEQTAGEGVVELAPNPEARDLGPAAQNLEYPGHAGVSKRGNAQ